MRPKLLGEIGSSHVDFLLRVVWRQLLAGKLLHGRVEFFDFDFLLAKKGLEVISGRHFS